ncbi:Charged multivesicular body protein 1a, related [Eimeria necatrix]|uniref:Charged multivesicular body protein 1a, related n=1 Tax=Eimeria necatrix TaxID=51315 RepID=U6MH45_9EIME|nr:Charged multivesicular body protein 1a, related [Eimeria necatrix]CDJ62393.1 Charged multivesicular body protein 1a, related [Eimeria necatrix]
MGNHHSVLPVILDLRIKARELKRQSDRCYRESLQEREKIRRALLRQNQEGARIFAQNYVRKKQEGLNSLHMSSKLEAVASRLDGAHRSHQASRLTTRIHSVASGLSGALRKLDSSSSLREIELFSKLFDDLDVRSDSVSSLLDASTSSAVPAQQVDKVLTEVASTFGISLEDQPEGFEGVCTPQKEQLYRQRAMGDSSAVYTPQANGPNRLLGKGIEGRKEPRGTKEVASGC